MKRNAVLSEYVGDKGVSNVNSGSSISSGNEHAFLGEAIDDNEDRGESMGGWQLFNKIHADRVPGSLWYRERL